MYEAIKLIESEYFYQRMIQEQSDYYNFRFNLSAFLTSTRSVMQYVLEEVKAKRGGQSWYDSKVAGSNILKYFKDKRDTNIHAEPTKPSMNITVFVPTMRIVVTGPQTESPVLEQRNREMIGRAMFKAFTGQEITKEEREMLDNSTIKTEDSVGGRSEMTYTFIDWSGPENALELCEIYLNILKTVVTEGQSKGFVTT